MKREILILLAVMLLAGCTYKSYAGPRYEGRGYGRPYYGHFGHYHRR